MRGFSLDLKLACRRLRSAPLFALFAIGSLGLGIGGTTAIYSLIHKAVLEPPAIPDIDEVVNLYHASPESVSGPRILFSWPDYTDLKAAQRSFSGMTAYAQFIRPVVINDVAEMTRGEFVEGDYFHVLRVPAALGRTIEPSDDRLGATPVVVLSDSHWRRRFAADPNVIGRTVRVGAEPFVVIGVTPPWFRGVILPNVAPTPLWIPISGQRVLGLPEFDGEGNPARRVLVKARLAKGVSAAAAAAELSSIGRAIDVQRPLGTAGRVSRRSPDPVRERAWALVPARDIYLHESVHALARPIALAALVIVSLVIAVASTNLANLLLARGSVRRHELAVKLALGASRWRLMRDVFAESTVIAIGGAVAAGLIAQALIAGLFQLEFVAGPATAMSVAPVFDARVLFAGAASAAVAFMVFGLGPAIALTGRALRQPLAADGSGQSAVRWRGRRMLIAAQVAVSMTLCAAASVLVQQLTIVSRASYGFDIEQLAIAELDFGQHERDEASARETLRLLLAQALRSPGVVSAAVASSLPIIASGISIAAAGQPFVPGSGQTPFLRFVTATPGFFETVGLELVAGRRFDDRDDAGSQRVVMLSERAAVAIFGRRDAVGQHVTLQRQPWVGEQQEAPSNALVIGVVANTGVPDMSGRAPAGHVYTPFDQAYASRVMLVARASGEPRTIVSALTDAVFRIDPKLAVTQAGTALDVSGPATTPMRIGAALTGILGVLALVLAMSGLYGVLSYIISGRTAEIGVRLALGADRGRIARMVLADGMRPVVAGIAGGLVVSGLVTLTMRAVMWRLVRDTEWSAVGAVPILFVLAATVACYLPARRACRVDPNVALKHL